MRLEKLGCFVIFYITVFSVFSQDVKMVSEYGIEDEDLYDISSFQGIEFYKVKFIGHEINQKNFILISKEIWDGAITKIDTVLNTSIYNDLPRTLSDTINMKVIGKRTNEPKLKLLFEFDEYRYQNQFDAIKSDDYSLRTIGTNETITYGKNFFAFAFILPYERGGFKFWCAIEDSGSDVENWGKEFGIKHYLVFEMKFF